MRTRLRMVFEKAVGPWVPVIDRRQKNSTPPLPLLAGGERRRRLTTKVARPGRVARMQLFRVGHAHSASCAASVLRQGLVCRA